MNTVGILGGGQLARMMALAGVPLGVLTHVYDASAQACAGHVATLHLGAFDDIHALREFAKKVDVLSFDFENVPAKSVQALLQEHSIYPHPSALAVTQDRLSEKQLLNRLKIPVAPFFAVGTLEQLHHAARVLDYSCILKTRRLGYDGKGQYRIYRPEDIASAWDALGTYAQTTGLIVEALLHFDKEVSIIAVRGRDGAFLSWPLTENWHVDGVLSASLAPVAAESTLQHAADAYARVVSEHLDYVGTLAIEFFVCGGRLIANEIAPRVHNSGHWTIEGAHTSQFENHLRAVLGLPLGNTQARGYSCMLNWIGSLPARAAFLEISGGHWHDYGKSARVGRKVGHATLHFEEPALLINALQKLGHVLQRQSQVAPVIDRLQASSAMS